MIKSIPSDSYAKKRSGLSHHAKTRLDGKLCHSCRKGRHDCGSLHCVCAKCINGK